MAMYATPHFRAINRQNTTPIKSSPLAVPSSVMCQSVAEETRQAVPSNASTRTLPVRALKIMASVEKYTPAPDDSEPEQPDSDYETESSATRDTTTESEQQAADEQGRADKAARERRRNGSPGGSSNTRQSPSLEHAQEELQETGKSPTASASVVRQQHTSAASRSTFQMVNIPRGPQEWCQRNPAGCSPQIPPRIAMHPTASSSIHGGEHDRERLSGPNSIDLRDGGYAGTESDRLPRPSHKRDPLRSSTFQIASPPQSSPPLESLDYSLDLERFRTSREMTACITTAQSMIRTLEASNLQLKRQQEQAGKGSGVEGLKEEMRETKEAILTEFNNEARQLFRRYTLQGDRPWQSEAGDSVVQLSPAHTEPIGERRIVQSNVGAKQATAGLPGSGPRQEHYENEDHGLDSYTRRFPERDHFATGTRGYQGASLVETSAELKNATLTTSGSGSRELDDGAATEPPSNLGRFSDRGSVCFDEDIPFPIESEELERLPLRSIDPNIQQSSIVDRERRMQKKKKAKTITKGVNVGKGVKRAWTPAGHAEELEHKRNRKSEKGGKRPERLTKFSARSIVPIGSCEDSSPRLAPSSSPIPGKEIEGSPGKAARRKAKRRHHVEQEEGSIELGMPVKKKRRRTRDVAASSQSHTEGEDVKGGRKRSKASRRNLAVHSEIPDTPEKLVRTGAKRKRPSDTEAEGSACEARKRKRSKRHDNIIVIPTPEPGSVSPPCKDRHAKPSKEAEAVVASSSRGDEAAGVAARHKRLRKQDPSVREVRQKTAEKDCNAHRAVAQAQENELAQKIKNAGLTQTASPQPTASSSKARTAHGTAKPTKNGIPQIEVVIPEPSRPPKSAPPPIQPPQPRRVNKSLTAPFPTRPFLPALFNPSASQLGDTLTACLARDRATHPAPAQHRSDIHPAAGLPVAMRRARSANTNLNFPIIADCTCGGSVPSFFSPHRETPDIDKWPGSKEEFWRWVKTIVECKGHDLLAKGRCEVLYWVLGPGKREMAAQSGSQKVSANVAAEAMVSAIDRSCRAISTISVDGFYGPVSQRARPAAVVDNTQNWDGDELSWRASPGWEALLDYDRDVAPYLDGMLE